MHWNQRNSGRTPGAGLPLFTNGSLALLLIVHPYRNSAEAEEARVTDRAIRIVAIRFIGLPPGQGLDLRVMTDTLLASANGGKKKVKSLENCRCCP
jgi:hypothetical protein